MWVVHRGLRAAYMVAYRAGVFSTPAGRSTYEYIYERYKLRTEASAISSLCEYITPGSLVVDVGANIGIYTEAFRKHAGDGGRVLAIEPDPLNAQSLRRRFGQMPAVTIVEAAATDAVGVALLERDPYNPAGHALSDQGLEVRSVTIDDLVAEIGLPFSAMKIDVEGAEPLVLKGSEKAISRFRPAILLEYSPERISKFDPDPSAYLRSLEDMGYEFVISSDRVPRTIPQIEDAAKRKGYVDVLLRQRPPQ